MLSPNTLLQERYVVLRQLGQGGMGAVYEATDHRFNRTVAIKQAFFSADALRRAFEREARLLNDLRHPALPVVIDYFAERDGWFLVMDYVPGEDLGTRLQRQGRPFAPEEVVRWADQVLDALEYLHGHEPPVIHRDIKPQNLKLTPRGDVRLLDFGLAKGTAAEAQGHTSGTSVAGYTPHYAPIEQVQGAGTDVRSDLYALAATMYHLMTARIPPDALARAVALLNGEPDPIRPVRDLNPSIPPDVAEIVHRALATSANQRPASAAAMRRALREAGGFSTPATVPAGIDALGLATDPKRGDAATVVAGSTTAPNVDTSAPTEVAPASAARGRGSRTKWIAAAVLGAVVIAGAAVAIPRLLTPPTAPIPEPKPQPEVKTPPPELRPFRYEALTVDAKGAVVERRKSEARSFVEDAFGVGLEMVEIPGGTFEMGAPVRRAAAPTPPFVDVAYEQEPRPAPKAMPRPTDQYPPQPRPRARPRPMPTNEPEPQPKPEPKRPEAKQQRAPEPEPPAEIEDESERPGHQVTVKGFFMSRYEITQAEWRTVARLPRVERDLNPNPSEFKGDTLPVDNVSWEDATEFCARLSRATGRTYRLPTEAEWEYACRAGSTGWFAFGPTITTDLVNYDGGSAFGEGPRGVARRKTLPVGGLGSTNAFGLSDMHGNVWEWCLDVWHADYAGAPADASAWTAGGDPSFRVIRGGSWITGPADCRSARRVNNPPGNRNSDVGFRVVME